jgi:hypothetical protein
VHFIHLEQVQFMDTRISKIARWSLLLLSALCAGLSPLLVPSHGSTLGTDELFPGWPITYEGKTLQALSLSDKEEAFTRNFPGKVARFSDGHREIIIRWINSPTRRLHPAVDCFKGSGHSITNSPVFNNAKGDAMGCFIAEKGSQRLKVCEYLEDQQGNTWSDVSAWYWSAMFNPKNGDWWSYVVAESHPEA